MLAYCTKSRSPPTTLADRLAELGTCTTLHSGNIGVWVWSKRLGKYVRADCHSSMKLNNSKVRWIVRQKKNGTLTNSQIAESMGVSVRWVQKLWSRHRHNPLVNINHPVQMGRPHNGMPGRKEHSAVLSVGMHDIAGSAILHHTIRKQTGISIPNQTVHVILKDNEMAASQPKKRKKRKWVRYERTYSNSLWHTDWKQIHGGMHDSKWFLCYQDDASRFVTGYGIFDEATTENALAVLNEAIKNHGIPAAIMTDHGSQFYANEKKENSAKRGVSIFEERLVELGIQQILAGVRHPQTNGKLERLHGEIQRKLHRFEEIMMRKSDPIDLFMKWYNYDRPHMSLDWDNLEKPAEAFARKMPPKGKTVIDKQTGEEYHVR